MKGYRCEPDKWHYADNMSRYSWRTLEQILGIVSSKFPGIGSQELFSDFLRLFSRIGYKNSLELVTGNSLDRVMRNSSELLQEISQCWIREIPKNGLREIPRNFPWFSCVRFLGISAHSQERFLGISSKLLRGKWGSLERNYVNGHNILLHKKFPNSWNFIFHIWALKGCKVVELSMQCCGKLLSDSFEFERKCDVQNSYFGGGYVFRISNIFWSKTTLVLKYFFISVTIYN